MLAIIVLMFSIITNIINRLRGVKPTKLEELQKLFEPTPAEIIRLSDVFLNEMKRNRDSRNAGERTMLDSHIKTLPTGNEKGTSLTLDVGGTNLRVCQIKVLGNRKFKSIFKLYKIPNSIKTGTGDELFKFIANKIKDFFIKQNIKKKKKKYNLSFTFSFPIKQLSIRKGYLIGLSKGFTCYDLIGKDMVKELQDYIDNLDLPINVKCLINDSVGTLIAASYKNNNTLAGIVIGTGTNAAYYDDSLKSIINTEWGDYFGLGDIDTDGMKGGIDTDSVKGGIDTDSVKGKSNSLSSQSSNNQSSNPSNNPFSQSSNNQSSQSSNNPSSQFSNNPSSQSPMLPRTGMDVELDRNSSNPGEHIFEKMISGKYLGELFRLLIIEVKELLEGEIEINYTPFSIDTYEMSQFFLNRETKERLFGITMTVKNKNILYSICKMIYKRSSMLIAIGIVNLYKINGLDKNKKKINISIDGSIYSKVINYSSNVNRFIELLLPGNGENIEITEESDGSSIGGAVLSCYKFL
eukprot:GHVP01060000.1.p1 GENE.GHVP01060000.1~~GHVP01060000.1.p1  ORF type:complete len:520 (+),score=70.23 GHVP01060000.1:1444-3003(+)